MRIGILVTILISLCSTAEAADFRPGDLVVGDILAGLLDGPTTTPGRLIAFDPFGNLILNRSVGGVVFGIAWDPLRGRVVYTRVALIGSSAPVVAAFDPVSEQTEILCSGGALLFPADVAVSSGGRVFIANPAVSLLGGGTSGPGSILEWDSSSEDPFSACGRVWEGTTNDVPNGIAVAPDGTLLYTDGELEGFSGSVYRVDPDLGTRVLIATGPPLVDPVGIASDPVCGTFIADAETLGGTGKLLRLDGNVVSLVFRGPPLVDPFGVAIEPASDCGVIVTNTDLVAALNAANQNPTNPDFSNVTRQLLRFDPSLPNSPPQVLKSGDPLLAPFGVTVPEPATLALRLAALALVVTLAGGRRRT